MFVVRVSDNFHSMDEAEVYTLGEYATWAEAVAAAREVVDKCLADFHQTGISADELYAKYRTFGDDAYITPVAEGERFSGWEYAKQRCSELCG